MRMNKWVRWAFHALEYFLSGLFILQILQPFISDTLLIKTYHILDFSSLSVVICYCVLVVLFLARSIYVLSYSKEWQINYLTISVVTCVIYAIYRYDVIDHPKWQFITFCGLDYFSFLYIISALLLTHGLWIARKNESEFAVESDEAINDQKTDKYGYYKYVKDLLLGVLGNPNYCKNRAFNIGIVGDWGTGKTSFLNLIDYAINQDETSGHFKKAIIIKFNPWFCKGKDQVQVDFLNVLQNALSPYNPEIKDSVYKYAKLLSKADVNWLSTMTKGYVEQKSPSLEQSFSKLSQCIDDIPLPVMIFIDDLDRLDGEEIMGVLKLVRNTANFKNTIFILSYDEDYILVTINEYTGKKPKKYLEKIINLPYSLPVVGSTEQQKINARLLGKLLSIEDLTPITLFFNNVRDDFSLRKIKIFAQSILLANTKVKDSLYLYDMILIEYLRLINGKLYRAVANNFNGMFVLNSTKILELNYGPSRFEAQLGKIEKLTDEEYIKKFINPFTSSDKIGNKCLHVLKLIFEGSGDDNDAHRLKYESVFYSYFTKVIPGDLISDKEFKSVLKSGIEKYNQKLREWIKIKNKLQLKILIVNIEFNTYEEGLELLNATIDIVYPNNFSEALGDPFLPKPGWNYLDIHNENHQLYEKVYKAFFIDNLLYDNTFDMKFIFLCSIGENEITKILGNRSYTEPIYNEVSNLFFNYLSVYLKHKNGFNEVDICLLNRCFDYIRGEMRIEAKVQIKNYLQDNILSFLNKFDSKNERVLWGEFLTFTFSGTTDDGLNDLEEYWRQNFREVLDNLSENVKERSEFKLLYSLV